MTTTTVGEAATAPAASHRRILGAAMAGPAVEFYDFYIFATAASLVFGPLFFPQSSPEAQLLQSWLTFALAFIVRPEQLERQTSLACQASR
jgi:hypothetical protein